MRRIALLAAAIAVCAIADAEAQRPPVRAFPAPADSSRGWLLFEEPSARDGSRMVTLTLASASRVVISNGRTIRPTLHIRCMDDRTSVYVNTGLAAASPPVGGATPIVRWRLDDSVASRERWTASADSQALFAPRAIPLARRLAESERLLLEFTPTSSAPIILLFDVRGAAPLVRRTALACGWRL